MLRACYRYYVFYEVLLHYGGMNLCIAVGRMWLNIWAYVRAVFVCICCLM